MRFFCPTLMDTPEEADKQTFLNIMLKKRPEYAIIWDVYGKDVIEFYQRVWVSQYVVIHGNAVYYSQSRHYATRAKSLFNLDRIVQVEGEQDWIDHLPAGNRFKSVKYYTPGVVDVPTPITMEDLIGKLLRIRPLYVVVWDIDLEDLTYIVSRAYVSSIMPVIDGVIHYSYGKHYAALAQRKFKIPARKQINIQNPPIPTW